MPLRPRDFDQVYRELRERGDSAAAAVRERYEQGEPFADGSAIAAAYHQEFDRLGRYGFTKQDRLFLAGMTILA